MSWLIFVQYLVWPCSKGPFKKYYKLSGIYTSLETFGYHCIEFIRLMFIEDNPTRQTSNVYFETTQLKTGFNEN